jgi:hypothetical protein
MGDQRAVGSVGDRLREHLRGSGRTDHTHLEVRRRRVVKRAQVGERHAAGQEQGDEDVRSELLQEASRRHPPSPRARLTLRARWTVRDHHEG